MPCLRRAQRAACWSLFAVLLLAGCHPTPPACSDASTLTLVRSALIEHVQKEVDQLPFAAGIVSNPHFQAFMAGLTMTLSDITSDGYNADAKKYSCHAQVTVSSAHSSDPLVRSIDYSTQATEGDKAHQWRLQFSGESDLVNQLALAAVRAVQTAPPASEAADQSSMEQLYLAQQAAANHEDANGVATRFGTLSVSSDRRLLFNGKPTVPLLEGNSGLTLLDKKSVGAQDIVLVQNNGGTACPASYYFILLSPSGAVLTQEFGTCSDLYQLQQHGQRLMVTLPGFVGPFETDRKRIAAAKQKSVYTLDNGVLTENGQAR